MGNIKYQNLGVMILFFGLALIEAIQARNWPKVIIFAALGLLSYSVDTRSKNNN
ncbi:hypothetical protein KW783_03680 [Candidatus Parcubacteria bacterium]|nr:hypothetical protein [Candidatus Parcubacteria bacterium]